MDEAEPVDGMSPTTAANPSPTPDAAEPNIDEARLRQQAIGVKLRQMFNDIVNEPVPDEFLDILRRADVDGRSAAGHD